MNVCISELTLSSHLIPNIQTTLVTQQHTMHGLLGVSKNWPLINKSCKREGGEGRFDLFSIILFSFIARTLQIRKKEQATEADASSNHALPHPSRCLGSTNPGNTEFKHMHWKLSFQILQKGTQPLSDSP